MESRQVGSGRPGSWWRDCSRSARRAAFALTFLFATFVAPASYAYLPPSTFIIGKMAEKRAALALIDLDVRMQTQYQERGVAELDEHLQIKRGGKLRLTRQEEDGEHVVIYRDGQLYQLPPAGTATVDKPGFEPLVDLLVPKAQAAEAAKTELLALVQKLGVDANHLQLRRFSSRVAFVLGEDGKPQLWIDKDNFLPVRVVYRGTLAGAEGLWDVQLREFGGVGSGDILPRVIDRSFGGKPISHSEVEKVSVNQKLADHLFAAPAVRR